MVQTKYKSLVTEKDAATHQVETVTHQWRAAQKVSDLMEEKNRTLTENMAIKKYETRLADLELQLVTMQQQLMAAREKANHSSRQVTELTEEKRRIVNSYETKLVEEKRSMEEYVAQLQQQKEVQQQTEEHSVSPCYMYSAVHVLLVQPTVTFVCLSISLDSASILVYVFQALVCISILLHFVLLHNMV